MAQAESIDHPFIDQIQRRSLLVGVVALAACVAGALLSPEQFFRSYLFGYLFWIGIALGSIALVMLHHIVGGGWGFLIRRLLEAASRTMPLMALLFIPILAGMHYIYIWTHADLVAVDEILQHKQPYLNVPFFITRAVVYFLIWTGMVFFLNRWSLEQDRTGDLSLSRRLQMLSGPGLLLYGITVTFASIDWVMSLEPHWFSTIYGLLFIIGQALATMALAIVMVAKLSDRKPLSDLASPKHMRDLGTLMFAFVMLWAYFSFSQWLIIWAGDLPEENSWYLSRIKGGWGWDRAGGDSVSLRASVLASAFPTDQASGKGDDGCRHRDAIHAAGGPVLDRHPCIRRPRIPFGARAHPLDGSRGADRHRWALAGIFRLAAEGEVTDTDQRPRARRSAGFCGGPLGL